MKEIKINSGGFPLFSESFENTFEFYTKYFEKELKRVCYALDEKYSKKYGSAPSLTAAMKYSLEAGGKRIRPVLCMEFCRLLGGNINDVIPACIAVEMIHTFSLIHDDLPCMDDDDFRRGKKSCHKAFGEAEALLAGDALEILAISHIMRSEIETEKKCKMVGILSECCYNMICGQSVDIISHHDGIESLYQMYRDKTSELIRAAVLLGSIAGGANDGFLDNADAYASDLGIAFQIVDDILDVIGDEKELGKPVGSDNVKSKYTSVTFLGIDGAKSDAAKYSKRSIEAAEKFDNNSFLVSLTSMLLDRKK